MFNSSSSSTKTQKMRQWYASFSQFVGYKTLMSVGAVLAVVFPDKAILIFNQIIQLKINILGFLLERLLQSLFDIPLRQAQILAAWIYLVIGVFLIWFLSKKLYRILFGFYFSIRNNWQTKSRFQKWITGGLLIILFLAVIKIKLLFL